MGILLASHNSWSFLPPRRWWQKVIGFTARCQSRDIRAQYLYGVRIFDLRLRFDVYEAFNRAVIAHGLVEYEPFGAGCSLYEDLSYLNTKGDVKVRVIHEVRSSECTPEELNAFVAYCDNIARTFNKIVFFGGGRACDGTLDYDFHTSYPDMEYANASAKHPRTWGLWPWLYAKLFNTRSWKAYNGKLPLMLDFIEL